MEENRKHLIRVVKPVAPSPNLQSKTATPQTTAQTITADEGYVGLDQVVIEATPLESKSITPSTTSQTVLPEAPNIGLSAVNIAAVTNDIDANIQASNIKKDITILGVTGTLEGGSSEYLATAKGLADGSLTSFSAPALGVTSLAYRRFYQMTNLQTLDLTGVTSIPEFTAYQCTGLTSLTLDPNITMVGANAFNECSNTNALTVEINGAVGDYAFRGVNIGVLKGVLTNTGQEAFRRVLSAYDTSNLSEIDIKVNGSIGWYLFTGSKNVSIFKLDPTSNITSLGVSYSGSAFSDFGSRRQNPSQNVFKFDLRNSTFTSVGQNTFRGYSYSYDRNKYFDIWLPSSLTTLYGGAFADTDYFNIYYKSIPSLSSTNVFNTATNYKNFFPYDSVQTARTSTNWSSSSEGIVNSIYGWAEENTFSLGDTLPATDTGGHTLTWYSDVALTNQVTTVSDPTQIYYCSVGA